MHAICRKSELEKNATYKSSFRTHTLIILTTSFTSRYVTVLSNKDFINTSFEKGLHGLILTSQCAYAWQTDFANQSTLKLKALALFIYFLVI